LNKEDDNDSIQKIKLEFLNDRLDLRLFIDHSILEIYINQQYIMTSRIYPFLEDSNRISLYSFDIMNNIIANVEIWKMKRNVVI